MSMRDPNRKPTHPGAVLREDVLPALGMTQTEFADRLGVGRLSVNQLLREKRAMSAEMALRIAHLLGTKPDTWVGMQAALDLWQAKKNKAGELAAIQPLPNDVLEGALLH